MLLALPSIMSLRVVEKFKNEKDRFTGKINLTFTKPFMFTYKKITLIIQRVRKYFGVWIIKFEITNGQKTI